MNYASVLTIFGTGTVRKACAAGAAILVAMGFLVALASGVGSDRTIVVEAETRWASIKFAGDAEAWPISTASICLPKERRDLAVPRGDGPCDARLFELSQSQTGFVEWGLNGQAEVMIGADGGLSVRVLRSGTYPAGTLILLDRPLWQDLGALSWIGFVTVGKTAESGESGLLLSGQFEIRELFRWFWPEVRGTEVVKSGLLRQGEQVALINMVPASSDPVGTSAMQGFGHIFPAERSDAFRLVSLTSVGRPALSIQFLGAERPAIIRPNWIDRVTSSPMLAALITVFAILISVTKFVGAWVFPKNKRFQDD